MTLDYETIIAVVGAAVPVGAALVGVTLYLAKLDGQIKSLRREFDNHPLLLAFKNFEQNKGVINFMDDVLKKSEVEGK